MKAIALSLAAIIFFTASPAASAFAQMNPDGSRRLWERAELTVTFGFGIPTAGWTTLHYVRSGQPNTVQTTASNRIRTTASADIFAGAAASFFFRPHTGFQAGFGYLKSELKSRSEFEFQASGGTDLSRRFVEQGGGELTAVPVFLALINDFDLTLAGFRLKGAVSFGPAVFLNSILTAVPAGTGIVRDGSADAFRVPVEIEDMTWIALGGTAGLSLDIGLTPSLTVVAGGRFFFCPRRNLNWTWRPGTYDGLFGNIIGLDFGAAEAADNERNTTPLTIRPSFIQIAAGLKFGF